MGVQQPRRGGESTCVNDRRKLPSVVASPLRVSVLGRARRTPGAHHRASCSATDTQARDSQAECRYRAVETSCGAHVPACSRRRQGTIDIRCSRLRRTPAPARAGRKRGCSIADGMCALRADRALRAVLTLAGATPKSLQGACLHTVLTRYSLIATLWRSQGGNRPVLTAKRIFRGRPGHARGRLARCSRCWTGEIARTLLFQPGTNISLASALHFLPARARDERP